MSLFDTLVSFVNTKKTTSTTETPDGFCPNCWGKQEYGGEFYEAVRNFDADINSHSPKDGWIKEYAKKNLSGIQLHQKDNELVCQNCKLTYRKEK